MFSSRIKANPEISYKRNRQNCFRLHLQHLQTNFQNILSYRFRFIPRERKKLNEKAFVDVLTVKTWTEWNENRWAHRTLHDKSNSENRDFLSSFVCDRRFMPLFRALSSITHEQGCLRECVSVRLFSTPRQSSLQDPVRIYPSVSLLCHKERQNVRSDWDFSQTVQVVTTRLCQHVRHILWQLCCETRNLV